MREVELSNGKTITVRPLKAREIDELAEYGVGCMRCEIFKLPGEKLDEAIKAMLHTQFEPGERAELPNPDQRKIFKAICNETWSSEEEEKNSSRSGPSDQTAPDRSTAKHA